MTASELPWVKCSDRMPDGAGVYLVYAESADPASPLYTTAFYDPECPPERQWSPLPRVWSVAVSHWLKPSPPEAAS